MSESAFPNNNNTNNNNKNGQFMDGNPKFTKTEAIHQDDAALKDSGPLFFNHQISRPPLQRVDSRPNFHPRSGFLPRFPPQGFPSNQRPIFRPQSPFIGGGRPQNFQQRPQIFQQNSLPAFRPRPFFEETFNRAQTLDSSELLLVEAHDGQKINNAQKMPSDQIIMRRPPSVASLGKTFSSENNALENSSSREISVENLTVFPLDRESERSGSPKMDKVEEIDKVHNNNNKENMDKLTPSSKEIIPSSTAPAAAAAESPKSIINNIKENSNLNLELNTKKEGDNNDDSGVDESTQGNNEKTCNGEESAIIIKTANNKPKTSSSTPTKSRTSLSHHHGSKTPSSSLQSPDSAATTPSGSIENKKKIPMNKIQVGAAPSPNLKVIKSKIGSLNNTSYKPGGGKVKIENKKLDFKGAAGSKIEAKNDKYVPKGGEKKILTQKLEWNAKSKIGSLENATYKPKGGDKKIESIKLNFKGKAASKVGSRENMKYQPGGGDVRIENKKIELNVTSKIGSLDNVKHKPAGGDKKIFDDKDYLKQQQKSGKSSMNQSLSGSQHSIQSQESKAPVADENLNQKH